MTHPVGRRSVLAASTTGLAQTLLTRFSARASTRRRTVRLGFVTPLSSAMGAGGQAFAKAADSMPELRDIMRIEVHSDGELGGDLEMAFACAAGTIDLVLASTATMATVPRLGALEAPFLFRDAAHARAVLDGPIGTEGAKLLRAKGLHVLAWAENGLRHVSANRPIRRPEDLRGLHIRVPQSEELVAGFRALGANVETLPFPELYEALREGRFEAQENPVVNFISAHFADVQRCLSLTGHTYSAAMFLASPDLLEDLSDAESAALVACAKIGGRASREAASRAEREGLAQLRAAGTIIVEDVDRTAFVAAAQSTLKVAGERLGADWVARISA